jgi:hypothetical protein
MEAARLHAYTHEMDGALSSAPIARKREWAETVYDQLDSFKFPLQPLLLVLQ